MMPNAADLSGYDVIFLGYPIWWNEAPRIVNTFIESANLNGKKVIPFATSGSDSISNSQSVLRTTYPDIDWQSGRLWNNASAEAVEKWVKSLL